MQLSKKETLVELNKIGKNTLMETLDIEITSQMAYYMVAQQLHWQKV